MKSYADTCFLISLYMPDNHSALAASYMTKAVLPLFWTRVHQAEFRNAVRLRCFRSELDARLIPSIFAALETDASAGVYESFEPESTLVWETFERLSESHTIALGLPAIDLLHVAQAAVLGAKTFLTFDNRQASLAKAAGLTVPKLI